MSAKLARRASAAGSERTRSRARPRILFVGGWDLQGPRTLCAFYAHENWVRLSKVPAGDRSAYEQEALPRILDSAAILAHLNCPPLAWSCS
eukprot:9395279-Pyramimonas_sp.AAC.1